MSITLSGLIVGVVQGRLLAGIFATYTSWRDTYWLAVGIQGGEFIHARLGKTVLTSSNGRWLVARPARYARQEYRSVLLWCCKSYHLAPYL